MNALPIASVAFSGFGLAGLLAVDLAGIVLEILALLGVATTVLTPSAIIAVGVAHMLGAQVARRLNGSQATARNNATPAGATRKFSATEFASDSGERQFVAGVTAAALSIVAVSSTHYGGRTLVGLLIVGLTLITSGGALSGLVGTCAVRSWSPDRGAPSRLELLVRGMRCPLHA